MQSASSKKLALLYIASLMTEETDIDHRLRQEDIAEILYSRYGIEVERKAVGRNLSLLREAGYDIVNTPTGCYRADRDFEPSELHLLIDSVLFSKHINPQHSRELVAKLSRLGGRHFRTHRKHVAPSMAHERNKNAASQLFYAIEMADEAIEKKCCLSFVYSKYGVDKRLHKSSEHVVSPYRMILQNQHYYLMAYSDTYRKISFFRMDKMSEVSCLPTPAVPLRSLPGYEGGIDYEELSSSLPYMLSERPIPVTFSCDSWLIDQVVDWFGYQIGVRPAAEEGRCLVTVKVSPPAMEYWAMQYARHVRVEAPEDLRQRIAASLREAADRYLQK